MLWILLVAVVACQKNGLFLEMFGDDKCTEKKGHVVKRWHEYDVCALVGVAYDIVNKVNDTAFHIKEECDQKCDKCRNEHVVNYKPGVCTQFGRMYAIMQDGPFTFGANFYGVYTWEEDGSKKCEGESAMRYIYGNEFCEENPWTKHSEEFFCDKDGVFHVNTYTTADCSGDPTKTDTLKTDYCYEEGWHDMFQEKIYCTAP